ncbi:MAG: hypothetical protein JWQ45_2257 [Blastococcus sp.]|jgi:hypothetical protein|nr:hypothetical protein [Blastococcus sp.]
MTARRPDDMSTWEDVARAWSALPGIAGVTPRAGHRLVAQHFDAP